MNVELGIHGIFDLNVNFTWGKKARLSSTEISSFLLRVKLREIMS